MLITYRCEVIACRQHELKSRSTRPLFPRRTRACFPSYRRFKQMNSSYTRSAAQAGFAIAEMSVTLPNR
jgi:hypothetical protein